jgi:flagellar FliL protein
MQWRTLCRSLLKPSGEFMATAAPSETAVKPQTGKKKLLIVILAVLLLLGLVGAGGLFYLKKRQAASAETDVEETQSSHKPVRGPKDKPSFVTLELFTVNLADRDVNRYAQVQMALEIRDEKASELIKAYMPILRSRILTTLSYRTSEQLLERHGKDRLARDLRTTIAKALDLLPPVVEEEALPPLPGEINNAQGKVPASRARQQPTPPELVSPVVAVHFSNFIIQ